MTVTFTNTPEWSEVLSGLKHTAIQKSITEAQAKLKGEEVLKGKKLQQAIWLGESAALQFAIKQESIDGVPNPTWNDPEWGNGAVKVQDVPEAEDITDLIAFLEGMDWSDFAKSLVTQYNNTGSLSRKQIASGRKMQATMAAKAKAKKSEAVVKSNKPTSLDLTDLPSGYYAVPNGSSRLKVRVARPTKASKWFGWTFVSDGAAYGQRTNYGRQAPSGKYQGDITEAIEAILADPYEAMVAYGKLTGSCGNCGRILEDESSIAAGIGPVCAAKW